MEMKYVVPDMAQSFGTLEFAGESDHVFDRDKDNRRVFARRSYNLYSDVQRGENVVVEIPVQAGEKHFKYEQKGRTGRRRAKRKATARTSRCWCGVSHASR